MANYAKDFNTALNKYKKESDPQKKKYYKSLAESAAKKSRAFSSSRSSSSSRRSSSSSSSRSSSSRRVSQSKPNFTKMWNGQHFVNVNNNQIDKYKAQGYTSNLPTDYELDNLAPMHHDQAYIPSSESLGLTGQLVNREEFANRGSNPASDFTSGNVDYLNSRVQLLKNLYNSRRESELAAAKLAREKQISALNSQKSTVDSNYQNTLDQISNQREQATGNFRDRRTEADTDTQLAAQRMNELLNARGLSSSGYNDTRAEELLTNRANRMGSISNSESNYNSLADLGEREALNNKNASLQAIADKISFIKQNGATNDKISLNGINNDYNEKILQLLGEADARDSQAAGQEWGQYMDMLKYNRDVTNDERGYNIELAKLQSDAALAQMSNDTKLKLAEINANSSKYGNDVRMSIAQMEQNYKNRVLEVDRAYKQGMLDRRTADLEIKKAELALKEGIEQVGTNSVYKPEDYYKAALQMQTATNDMGYNKNSKYNVIEYILKTPDSALSKQQKEQTLALLGYGEDDILNYTKWREGDHGGRLK